MSSRQQSGNCSQPVKGNRLGNAALEPPVRGAPQTVHTWTELSSCSGRLQLEAIGAERKPWLRETPKREEGVVMTFPEEIIRRISAPLW